MESTQMPINDRLDKENVVHIHYGLLCRLKRDYVLCRDMNGAGSHYPREANTGTENQTLRVRNHKWKLNNESTRTQEGEQHTLGPVWVGEWEKGEHQELSSKEINNLLSHTSLESSVYCTPRLYHITYCS